MRAYYLINLIKYGPTLNVYFIFENREPVIFKKGNRMLRQKCTNETMQVKCKALVESKSKRKCKNGFSLLSKFFRAETFYHVRIVNTI